MPALLLHAPQLPLSEQTLPQGLPLDAPLQLWGPFNDVPSAPQPVPVLDLSDRATSLFSLTSAGQLFVARLVR